MPVLFVNSHNQGDRIRKEFSSTGRLFTLGSFFKLQNGKFGGYFLPRKKLCINFDKKIELSYILGYFFTNSSGHPASQQVAHAVSFKPKI
jgi:hypothetical protein